MSDLCIKWIIIKFQHIYDAYGSFYQ
jgi:hypothetical protein